MSKLLPKTPTALMVDAGIKIIRHPRKDWEYESEYIQKIYQAMYAASGRKEHEVKDQP